MGVILSKFRKRGSIDITTSEGWDQQMQLYLDVSPMNYRNKVINRKRRKLSIQEKDTTEHYEF